jgi:hypothetical protein
MRGAVWLGMAGTGNARLGGAGQCEAWRGGDWLGDAGTG